MSKTSSKRTSKIITVIAVILIILIVSVALVPFLSSYITDTLNEQKWRTGTETSVSVRNNTANGTFDAADPNYSLNYTADNTYTIDDASSLDYQPNKYGDQQTKYGESYICSDPDNRVQIIVTNETGSPIANQNLIITAYAKKTNADLGLAIGVTAGGLTGAILVASTIGLGTPLAPMFAIIGLGCLIGGVIGGEVGMAIDNSQGHDITMFDHETISADQGSDFNKIGFGKFGGLAGDWNEYSDIHILIEMPEDTSAHYSPFAVTDEISFNYNANIYVRLVNGDQKLMEIQNQIKGSQDYQGMRYASSIESAGCLEGFVTGYGGHDAFRGIDTANLTQGSAYYPMVSVYDNEHVFKVSERRFIQAKDLTGIDLHVDPAGVLYFGMITFDSSGNAIIQEDGYAQWTAITDINNESQFGSGYDVTLSSNNYYSVNVTYYISLPSSTFYSMMYVQYECPSGSGVYYIETLGMQKIEVDHEQFTTSFEYKYNVFFTSEQTIHRTLYDINDKEQLMCDFRSPYFLNGTESDFVLRFFITIPNGIWGGSPQNVYPFAVQIEILDGDTVVLSDSQSVNVPPSGIASGIFTEDMRSLGLEDLTSYQLRISCHSSLDFAINGSHIYAVYSNCLYYTLKNYNEFMTDVKNLDQFLAALTSAEDVSDATYQNLKDIMGVMKSKINDLEGSLNELRSSNPDAYTDIADKVQTAISHFKDYYLWVMEDMDTTSAADLQNNVPAYSKWRGDIFGLRMYYADSFVSYNSYVAGLKGESGIAADIGKTTKGYEDYYEKKWAADRNRELNKYLPSLVILFAIMIAGLIAGICYYLMRNRIKNKYIVYVLTIAIFGISAVSLYLFLLSMSGVILHWYYGV